MEGDSWSGDRKKWQKNVGNGFLSTSDPYGQRKELAWLLGGNTVIFSSREREMVWGLLARRKSALTIILQFLV